MSGAQTLTFFTSRDSLINSNDRLHWRVKAKKTRALRDFVAVLAWQQLHPVTTRQHITVTFGFTNNNRRDVDNLQPTSKAWIDGIVDAGILPDDNDNWCMGPDLRTGPPSPDMDRPAPLRRVHVTITLEDAS